MSLAVLIRRMTEAGAPLEAIAIAVEEIEALQASLDARRGADRERKRAQRERLKSADVTGHSEDMSAHVPGQTPSSLDKEKSPPSPLKENNLTTPVCANGARARGWHRLPEDWLPRKLPIPVQAKVDLWPPGALDDELAAFRRWAANAENKNGKGRKLDWDQAWRNWIGRRHDERYGRTNSLGRDQPTDGLSSTARAALQVFGR